MRISLVAAVAENQVIGKDGTLPWKLPNDLKFFRNLTAGHPVIMGRKTYESIGRPLPDRENIIITRQQGLHLPDCFVVHSLSEAVRLAEERFGASETFVIGGAEIFAAALSLADRVYLTRVHAEVDGDVFFPLLPDAQWEEVSREEHQEDVEHLHAYTFIVYERRKTAA